MSNILIVEDEHVLRVTFQQFLEEEGYTVAVAEGYNEAVGHLDDGAFDVVVTDIVLGGKTGIDLLRTIQQREMNCQVVMITGDPSIDTASEAVRLGAFDYIPKPVTGPVLKRVIRLACDRNELQAERDRYAAQIDQARRELETIFNSVNEGIVTVDAALRIAHVNEAARTILQLPRGHLGGEPLSGLLSDELAPARLALEETVAGREPTADTRMEVRLSDGRPQVLRVSTVPLVDEGGAVLVVRDTTRLSRLEEQLEETQGYHGIIGKSPKMQQLFDMIENVKDTDSTVLICGESGTGKERIAAAIQGLSRRAKGPYIKVNCAALSEDVLESELFGHVKGAFTGAFKDRMGRFEAADAGTILLDEIGDVSVKVQLRLLRVLQEREFERVGDTRSIQTDVRVIVTTNQDLVEKIQTGDFRQDLYYRLNVVRLEAPPLREKSEDVPLLVEHFRRHFNALTNKDISGIAPETMEIFMRYPWLGNVRELENCIERAFVVCKGTEILPAHLPPEIESYSADSGSASGATFSGKDSSSLKREQVLDALRQTDWNVAKTAKKLGVARNTLYLKMKTFDLSRPAE